MNNGDASTTMMKIVTTLTLTLTWLAKIARNGKFVPTNGHFGRMLSIDRLLFWALTFFFVIYYYKPLTIELCPWFGWKKDIGVPFSNLHQPSSTINRELKKRRRQWEGQESSRLRLEKQHFVCISLLSLHNYGVKLPIIFIVLRRSSDTRQRLSLSFSELRYSPLEFNSRRNLHHMVNWTRWNTSDRKKALCLACVTHITRDINDTFVTNHPDDRKTLLCWKLEKYNNDQSHSE